MVKESTNKTLIMIGLLLGLVFSELDQTAVSTALPTIIRELHGLSLFGWVAGIYMLAITVFMPIFGKMADLYGRKRIYLGCVALFMVGSILCGLSDSMTQLLIGRCVQGIGAGGLMPLAMIIIGDSFPLEQRAKVQSLIGPMLILPQLIGPTIGGYFVSHINWHWIFLINIPVGLVAGLFVAKGLRESVSPEKKQIDWAGAATLVLAILSLLFAPVLIDVKGYAWSSPIIIGLLVLSALFVLLFIRIEARAAEPIIPLSLFRNRSVVVLSIIVFITMLGVMGGMSGMPFFAQIVMGLTPTASGYLSLGFMAGAIPMSIVCGFLITRVAYKYLFIGSFVLPIVGYFLLSRVAVDTTVLYILAAFFILGLGIGVLFGSDNLIVQETVSPEHTGVGVATVQLFQSLGATLGFSIFGSLLSRRIHDGIAGLSDQFPADAADSIMNGGLPSGLASGLVLQIKTVFADAFQEMFLIGAIFAAAAFLACWFMKREVLTPKPEAKAEQAAVIQG
ncbi:MDR family MFS transporter [Paenibacillus sacheonensis]|uniref:MFS transporter n=1 Tax=Paenibacillus sacheonensis TaxID=742054 RepID=A0A7X5BZT9_9BACL|nr:MDR family MFS transporter [Paenibacillus sacheonensis]MBM7563926.1 EmrB/QacA subfamily drug resistance transporter [Paenibacillus sacheonensis]NBC67729.1 MFS transporter [Paenibacillus sacheonensis]